MRYLPHTPEEIQRMSEAVGVRGPEELFEVIPEALRLKAPLELPKPLSEIDLVRHLKALGRKNETVDGASSFLGGGAYHHYIPVAVSTITSRGEFMTSYTPYQPEISQGTLQAIFEFQTMIASLTGMDLANAGNYDGASALAEAVLMALRLTDPAKKTVLLAQSIHPDYRQVVKTYLSNIDCRIVEVPFGPDGRVDAAALKNLLNDEVAVCCVQSPNAFGVIEEVGKISAAVKGAGAMLVGCFSEAVSLGLLEPMGRQGADIVVGEGASFGNFLNLGGPYLGLFATKKEFVRQMPGRLVGETVDAEGKRGFVLVLSTREQHIRREKATSNICTNQALCALATTVYLSLLGPQGLKKLARINYSHAHYLREGLLKIPGVQRRFSAPHFNEFAVQLAKDPEEILSKLRQKGILGGIALKSWAPGMERSLLVCATEMNSKAQMDDYVRAMREVL
ncbi:aminomethyl-transferring glycine dehydrogenase subunit GcvPA [Deltaproteobacteria bacterium PRO3]|nr:aminomethyl-transferring glycine dehydrogenase subunit GcvPA [Deltaproteobacteria bacterium PRO3]